MGQWLCGDGPPVEQGNGRPGASYPRSSYRPEGAELLCVLVLSFHCNLSQNANYVFEQMSVCVCLYQCFKMIQKLSKINDFKLKMIT